MKILNNLSKVIKVPPRGVKLEGEEPFIRDKYRDDLDRVLVSRGCISERVGHLADEVADSFKELNEINCLVVLKGSIFFAADLIRIIDSRTELRTKIDFINASSYYNKSKPSEKVEVKKTSVLKGDNILLIEDIVDTGGTLKKLQKYLDKKDKFFKTCVLLDKGLAENDVKIDFLGFRIPNEFVAGYGLDYAGKYRGLPEVSVVKKELLE